MSCFLSELVANIHCLCSYCNKFKTVGINLQFTFEPYVEDAINANQSGVLSLPELFEVQLSHFLGAEEIRDGFGRAALPLAKRMLQLGIISLPSLDSQKVSSQLSTSVIISGDREWRVCVESAISSLFCFFWMYPSLTT